MKRYIVYIVPFIFVSILFFAYFYFNHYNKESSNAKIEHLNLERNYKELITILEKKDHLTVNEQFILANSYFKEKDYNNAVKLYNTILNENISLVESSKVYLNLGSLYIEMGNLNLAEKMYLNAVESSKNQLDISIDAKKAAGYFISEFPTNDNVKQGIQYLMDVGEKENNNPEIDYRLGKLIHFLGDYEYAIRFIKSSLKKDQTYIPAYLELADVYINMQEFKDAIEVLKLSLNMERNSKTYELLGKAYEGLHKNTESISYYNQAIVLSPSNSVESRLGLVRIYIENGNKKAASEQVYIILKSLPEDSAYRKNIEKLYSNLIPRFVNTP